MDKELIGLIDELQADFDRWEYLKEYGGSDPFWADGVNMDLKQTHIINGKRRIKDYCDDKGIEYPEIYYRETPPDVDPDYMAKKEQIREQAIKSLEIYENDEGFKRLESLYSQINNEDKKQIATNILGYKRGLKKAIESNDYLTMRRHGNPKSYLDSPKRFLKELAKEDMLGQISMF